MAKVRGNKCLCDMYFTQKWYCFWTKYIVNTNMFTLHDSRVMLVPSTSGNLSVHYDGIIGSWLFLPSGKLLSLGSFIMRSSSSFEAQGEVNLPRAASHYYQAFFPALFWVKLKSIYLSLKYSCLFLKCATKFKSIFLLSSDNFWDKLVMF